MKEKAMHGKPHVRFDEGEVVSAATPRRGSLLCKRCNLHMALCITTAVSVQSALCSAKAEPLFAKYRFDAKSNTYQVDGTAKVEAFVADRRGALATNGVVGGARVRHDWWSKSGGVTEFLVNCLPCDAQGTDPLVPVK